MREAGALATLPQPPNLAVSAPGEDVGSPQPGAESMAGPPAPAPPRRDPTSSIVSQFSDPSISSEEALALCGPAAAISFAQFMGRNPTLAEARDIAQRNGLWSKETGMY